MDNNSNSGNAGNVISIVSTICLVLGLILLLGGSCMGNCF